MFINTELLTYRESDAAGYEFCALSFGFCNPLVSYLVLARPA